MKHHNALLQLFRRNPSLCITALTKHYFSSDSAQLELLDTLRYACGWNAHSLPQLPTVLLQHIGSFLDAYHDGRALCQVSRPFSRSRLLGTWTLGGHPLMQHTTPYGSPIRCQIEDVLENPSLPWLRRVEAVSIGDSPNEVHSDDAKWISWFESTVQRLKELTNANVVFQEVDLERLVHTTTTFARFDNVVSGSYIWERRVARIFEPVRICQTCPNLRVLVLDLHQLDAKELPDLVCAMPPRLETLEATIRVWPEGAGPKKKKKSSNETTEVVVSRATKPACDSLGKPHRKTVAKVVPKKAKRAATCKKGDHSQQAPDEPRTPEPLTLQHPLHKLKVRFHLDTSAGLADAGGHVPRYAVPSSIEHLLSYLPKLRRLEIECAASGHAGSMRRFSSAVLRNIRKRDYPWKPCLEWFALYIPTAKLDMRELGLLSVTTLYVGCDWSVGSRTKLVCNPALVHLILYHGVCYKGSWTIRLQDIISSARSLRTLHVQTGLVNAMIPLRQLHDWRVRFGAAYPNLELFLEDVHVSRIESTNVRAILNLITAAGYSAYPEETVGDDVESDSDK